MLYNVRQNAQNFDFGASIAMQIEDCFSNICVLLFNDDGTDIFALIIDDLKIESLDDLVFDELLFWQNGVYVVRVFAWSNDALPTPLEVFLQGFH